MEQNNIEISSNVAQTKTNFQRTKSILISECTCISNHSLKREAVDYYVLSPPRGIADLPLILILSVYTDFLPLEFGKIQIFFLEIWQNTDFFNEWKGFLYIFFIHTDFFPKILISLVIYTDFVL